MANDLTTNIVANATSPQAASADGVSVTSQSVEQQILADQYLAAKAAAGNTSRGLRFTKLTMGGQVSGVPGNRGGFDRLC